MITPYPQAATHKAWMFRLLNALFDDADLASVLYFKGGTCAAMRGFLDRFSVDLDFDYAGEKESLEKTRHKMEDIFKLIGLEIKDNSRNVPQYFLRYPAGLDERNTLKIDICFPIPETNQYESVRLDEIDRIIKCQTIETMVANKLIALIGRFEQNKKIAGRDLYDVHYFLWNGFRYDSRILEERRGCPVEKFLEDLITFTKEKITQEIIDQDINTLLETKKFQAIRKTLKQETLALLRGELDKVRK